MKKLLLSLLLFLKLGTDSYINITKIIKVRQEWIQGNKRHPGHIGKGAMIQLIGGYELNSTWSIEKILKTLKENK